MKNRKIIINTNENKYPILIGKNLSFKLGSILSKNSITPSKILFIIDNKVPKKIISKITKKSFLDTRSRNINLVRNGYTQIILF